MKKKDLKSGMILVLRNGDAGIVILNSCCTEHKDIILTPTESAPAPLWADLSDYNANLRDKTHPRFDVMEIWKPKQVFNIGSASRKDVLLWKRQERKKHKKAAERRKTKWNNQ